MKQTREDDVEQYTAEQYEAKQKAIKWNKAEQHRNYYGDQNGSGKEQKTEEERSWMEQSRNFIKSIDMGKSDRYRNDTTKQNEMEMNKQQQNISF